MWIWIAFINDPNIHRANYLVDEVEPIKSLQLNHYRWIRQENYILASPTDASQRTMETFLIVKIPTELQPACIVEVGQDPRSQHFAQLVRARPLYFETSQLKIPLLETSHSQNRLLKRHRDRGSVAYQQLALLAQEHNTRKLQDRITQLGKIEGTVKSLLLGTTWKQIWKTDGILLPYQTFFWYRASTGRLSFYNPSDPKRICQLCPGKQESTEHLLWDCVLARRVWQQLQQKWTGTRTSKSQLTTIKLNIFQRQPPAETVRYRYTKPHEEMASPNDILMAWNEAWMILSTSIATSLWTKRNDRVYNQTNQPLSVQAQQIFTQAYHQLEAIAHFRAKHQDRTSWLWWVVKHIKDPPKSAFITTRLRLFFDGGSRGNPGVGGSGWIVLEQRSNNWIPLKAGWQHHQEPCSNNKAEFIALWSGLKAAHLTSNTSHTSMEVIGDSQFVQKLLLAHYHSKKFKSTTIAVHHLLAQFCQIAIFHTRRKWNTMADHLANKAMDLQTHGCLTAAQLHQKSYQEMISNDSLFETTKQQSYRNLGSLLYS